MEQPVKCWLSGSVHFGAVGCESEAIVQKINNSEIHIMTDGGKCFED